MSKGGSEQGPAQTSTTVNTPDPDIKGAYLTNVDYARNVGNQMGARQFAGFDPLYQQGEAQAIAAANGIGRQQLGMAADLTQAAAGFTPTAIRPDQALTQQYYNPFEQQVIDTSLRDLESARQRATQQMGQQAMAAKAFGGSRHGVAEALTAGEYGKQAGSMVSNLRNQGYQQALQLAQAQQLANQSAGLQGAQFRLGAAGQLGQMGQGQTAADMLAAQSLMGLGGARQQFAQQQMDASRNLGLERLGIMQSALGLQMPGMGGTTTATTPGQTTYSNPASGALGGALAGYSMFPGTPYGAIAGGLLGLMS
jgi:hypothetical protein